MANAKRGVSEGMRTAEAEAPCLIQNLTTLVLPEATAQKMLGVLSSTFVAMSVVIWDLSPKSSYMASFAKMLSSVAPSFILSRRARNPYCALGGRIVGNLKSHSGRPAMTWWS